MANSNIQVSQAAVKSHRRANIAVAIVASIAALIIIAIIVMSTVRVDPIDKLDKPNKSGEHYDLYDLGSSAVLPTNDSAQSKIRSALGSMDFSIMNAVLQWNWDYSYNFVRNKSGKKIEMSASQIDEIAATATQYMVEYVYTPAVIVNGEIDLKSVRSLTVDGEKIYFDRVKMLIGDTDGSVGEIYMYPYIYDRVHNRVADDGMTYATYKITAVKVRANTTSAFAALGDLVDSLAV